MADRISFLDYQPPGVYTQTILSSESINLSAGFRIPTFIGTADVLIENTDVPVVRGSSKNFPVFVEREDVSSQANGSTSIFKTKFGPIVDPLTFLATENIENVVISVNDKSTNPLLIEPENVDGVGEVHLTFTPDTGDEIYISYYYIIEDVAVIDEDLSYQIENGSQKTFYTKHKKVVDSEGDVTNDVTDIAVKVNGASSIVSTLNGTTGQFVLQTAPGLSAVLTISYTYSNHIDKNDPLPNKYIHSISRVGNVSGRKDYVNGVDYNFSFERSINDTTFHEISWGNSFALTSMQKEDQDFQYDWIPGDHLTIDVHDKLIFAEVAIPVDTTEATTAVFKVKNPIMDGTGKGSFLNDPEVDPGVFDFYVGSDVDTAITAEDKKWTTDSDALRVVRVEGDKGYIHLNKAVDPSLDNLYIIYRASFTTSDQFTLSKTLAASGGNLGQYTMFSPSTGYVSSVSEGTHTVADGSFTSVLGTSGMYAPNSWLATLQGQGKTSTASFPSYADIIAPLNMSQDEVVTVTVIEKPAASGKLRYTVTSDGLIGSDVSVNTYYADTFRAGTLSNEGFFGEAFVDPASGLYLNLSNPGDILVKDDILKFNVTKTGVFELQDAGAGTPVYNMMIPGISILTDEENSELTVGDEVILNTYDNAGAEPNVGDTYYVSYKYFRTDFKHRLYLRFSEVVRDFGIPNMSNPLSMAAKLAFENGAPVVGVKPLPRYLDSTFQDFLKTEDFILNPDSATAIQLFKDAFDDIEAPFDSNSESKPYVVVPLSDDSQVWSYGKAHVEKMSSTERRMNRYMITGFNTNKKDSLVIERARNLKSNRMMITYPVSAVMDLETSVGEFTSAVVPGWFYGAAIAGLIANPGTSPSEPLLNKNLQGFKETGIFKNPLEYNQIAKEGVTILTTKNPVINVRDALNTDMTSVATKEPNVTFIADFVEGQTEIVMNRFVGRPFINTILGEVETVFSAFLQELQRAGIIFDYKNIEVRENENDRTIVEISAGYRPVLGVKYVFVTYRIQGS